MFAEPLSSIFTPERLCLSKVQHVQHWGDTVGVSIFTQTCSYPSCRREAKQCSLVFCHWPPNFLVHWRHSMHPVRLLGGWQTHFRCITTTYRAGVCASVLPVCQELGSWERCDLKGINQTLCTPWWRTTDTWLPTIKRLQVKRKTVERHDVLMGQFYFYFLVFRCLL